MNHNHTPLYKRIVIFIIAVLLTLLLILCLVLFRKYEQVASMHIINPRTVIYHNQMPRPMTIATVGLIQSWMTFQYIDQAFNIPPQYLQSSLHISDLRYPRIPIGRYAMQNGVSQAVFVQQVKDAVTDYLNSSAK
jgi:hypothetical protein